MVTVGLDQHSVPFKPDGTFYKTYTAFNQHKMGPLLDYTSIHGYNWWGEYVNEFIEGLLRYSYVKKPVVLEEFNLTELNNSLKSIQRSGSGWLQWAAFASQADWESCLFDSSENITSIGTAFKNIADSVKEYASSRPQDTQLIDMDLKDVLVSRMAQDTVYRKYVKAVHDRQSPAGFNVINFQLPQFLKMKVPAENEKIQISANIQLQWDIINWNILYKATVDLKLSRDAGNNWETITANTTNDGSYNWSVTGPASDSCIIAVVDHNDSTVLSTQNFSISSATAVESSNNKLHQKYSLEQNYPNPFNPSTTISWQLPVNSWLTLKVFDVLGSEVITLVNEYKQAGNYNVKFEGSKYPSGLYFYQLKAGNFVQTKKMVLLR